MNAAGQVPKIAVPILMVVVVRAYGAAAFGAFALAQASFLLATRVLLLGVDKALLWWIPQHGAREVRGVLRRSLAIVVGLAAAAALAVIASARWVAGANADDASVTAIRALAAALPFAAALDVYVAAAMGLRRMEPNVVVKETVMPILQVGLALVALPVAGTELGLPAAHVASYGVCALLAWRWWERLDSARGPAPPGPHTPMPARFIRYAVPMWLTEMSNSFVQRMDMYAVAALMDVRTLGVYAAVTQVANTLRQIRRSFDPIVLVMVSEIGSLADRARLRATFSYATYLVTGAQIPVLGFVLMFADWLMPLFGEGFSEGTRAVVLLSAFWVANSAVSLAGVVVSAYGRSHNTLINVWLAAAIQGVALWILVPAHGLVGAAGAVGIAYSVQSIAQVVQMRAATGGWNFDPSAATPLVCGALAGAVAGGVVHVAPLGGAGDRVLAYGVGLIVYAAAMWRGRLRQPRSPGALPVT